MAESQILFWTTNLDYDLILLPHLMQTLQKDYSEEPKSYMTKPRKMPCSRTSKTKGVTTKKAKASPLKEKDYCFILQPKADHQGSKTPFRDFRWIGRKSPTEQQLHCPKTQYEQNSNPTQTPPQKV